MHKQLELQGLTPNEINSAIAVLTFIILNASKYTPTDQQLINDLVNLGLPKENCESIAKVIFNNLEVIAEALKKKEIKGMMEMISFRKD